jgi:hypothetical protein
MMARQALNRKQTRAANSRIKRIRRPRSAQAERRRRLTDQEVLERLAALRVPKGYLSNKLICHAQNVPDATTLIKRFDSLTAAYRQVGFQPRG